MRTRKMSKMLAAILSAAMVMSMSMTAFAADDAAADTDTNKGTVEVEAPIYAYDFVNVVVPTAFKVAFNPTGLEVTTGTDTTTRDQIVSKNYGIINKSSKDKIITVTLNVTDQNDKISFVSSTDEVDNAEKDEYAIYLTAVAADSTEVKVGAASADKETDADALGDVAMTKAADTTAVALSAGENEIAFKLDKADYALKADASLELGGTTTNNVADLYEVSALAGAGKGITAFTFDGKMNDKADWTQLGSSVKITAVYDNETAETGATTVTGTGALYVNPAPKFSTGSEVGTIKYKKGTGDDALKSITKIEMDIGGMVDGYNASSEWEAATDVNGVITLNYIHYFTDAYPDDATREAVITYITEKGETKTATVDVKLR